MFSFITVAALLFAPPTPDLEAAVRRFQTSDEAEERIAALTAISNLEADPGEVVAGLALGLSDEVARVRLCAVRAMGRSDRVSVAAEHFEVGCQAQLEIELKERHEQSSLTLSSFLEDNAEIGDKFQQLFSFLEKQKELEERVAASLGVRQAYIEVLEPVRTDSAARCLATLGGALFLESESDPLIDALLFQGRRCSVASVVAVFERYDQQLDLDKDLARELKRARPGKRPKGWKKDAWKKYEKDRIDKFRARFEARVAEQEAWMEALVRKLMAFARENDLGKAPDRTGPILWDSWWKRNRGSVPESFDSSGGE